jgi:hypothetical protein
MANVFRGRKALATWIDEALVDKDKSDRISALSLVHMIGQQRQEIHTVKIGASGSYDGAELEKLFRGKAESYAQDLGTVQMFALLAFYGKNTEEAVQPFTVTPAVNPENAGFLTEAPTAEGRLQQKMRWDDANQMAVYRRQQSLDEHSIRLIEVQGRMLDRSQSMVERLMTENMDAFTIVKDLLAEKQLSDHDRAMKRMEFERATGERQKLLQFAPVLINTILGREIFPQSTEDTALIETIAESLEPEHIEKLANMGLPPMLMGPLAARVMKAMEKKEQKAQEAQKVLPRYRGTAEEDIGGGS